MTSKIYTVHAYRWGDRECHSYIVGVYQKKHEALKTAQDEQEYRGGKYECEVREWVLGQDKDASHPGMSSKEIKPLPSINALKRLQADH